MTNPEQEKHLSFEALCVLVQSHNLPTDPLVLTEDERRHADSCGECQTQARQLHAELGELREGPSEELSKAKRDSMIELALGAATADRQAVKRGPAFWYVTAAAALILFAIGAKTWGLGQRSTPRQSPTVAMQETDVATGLSTPVLEGQKVVGGGGSGVRTLVLGDSTNVSVFANAIVEVNRGRLDRKQLALREGTIVMRVEGRRENEQIELVMPFGVVHVSETAFAASVDGDRSMVTVLHGRIIVRAPGRADVILTSNETYASHKENSEVRRADTRELTLFDTAMLMPSEPLEDLADSTASTAQEAPPAPLARNPANRRAPAIARRSQQADGGQANDKPVPNLRSKALQTHQAPTESASANVDAGVSPIAPERAPAQPPLSLEAQAQQRYSEVERMLLARKYRDAETALTSMVRTFGSTATGELALYELARLREQHLGDTRGAARAYADYLQRGRNAPLYTTALSSLCRLSASHRACPKL